MNPAAISTTIDPTAPPPEPPKPSRSSFSCDRHPAEQFTGFCPTCLCERLNTLENSSNCNTPSSSRRPSSVTAAIKSLFSVGGAAAKPPKPSKQQPTSFSPKLRRTKSFSASKNEALLGTSIEPQRKSCDVRARGALMSAFTLEKEDKNFASCSKKVVENSKNVDNGVKVESCAADNLVVPEIEEDDEEFKDAVCLDNSKGLLDYDDDDDVIRPVPDNHMEALRNKVNSNEIVNEVVLSATDLKTMKDHIDLDVREKKNTSGAGGFWAAASVFSKKWHKWRQKQKKMKKPSSGVRLTKLPVEKPIMPRRRRDTQFEIADNGLGRRSCDTDPRFSLDTGRISFDDPRYSSDKPRASWDGHLVGKSFPRMAPMVPLTEKVVPRFDMQIPVEEPLMKCINEDDSVPGGLVQTRDYYLDSSSSSRRKSLDRSSSVRKIVAEINELKTTSNASGVSSIKVDSFHEGESDMRGSNSNSLRDDCSEMSNGLRSDINLAMSNGEGRGDSKKSKSWSWRIWGLISRRISGSKEIEVGEDEKFSKVNGVQRSLSESWQDFRGDGISNGYTNNAFDRSAFRSNSSVSWRSGGSFGNVKRSVLETNCRKRDHEIVLEKNRSARYSPNRFENNGLLRLYLAPMRSGQRGGGLGNIRPNNSHSIARSVLRLY